MRPASPRLDSGRRRSGRMPHVAGRRRSGPVGAQGRRQRDAGRQARGTKRLSGPAAGPVVTAKRRTERERAGLLRYYPQYGGDRSGVFRDQAVPTTWRGIGDRSARACAGVGIGLVSECLRGPSNGGPLRGYEKCGKPTGNNNLPAVDRGWRVGLVTNIANTTIRRERRNHLWQSTNKGQHVYFSRAEHRSAYTPCLTRHDIQEHFMQMTPDYIAVFSGRLPALERNILKYRALQMILVMFYCEHLKRKMQAVAQTNAKFRRILTPNAKTSGRSEGKRLSQKESMKFLQELKFIHKSEESEIIELIDFRNMIAHEIHKVVSDVAGNSLARQFSIEDEAYRYDAVARLKYYIDLLESRIQQDHHVSVLSFDSVEFGPTEKTYEQELEKLRHTIDRQYAQRMRIVTKLNEELALKDAEGGDKWHPRNLENKYANGRLTKHGVEVCYRLYDAHKSPMAVALLMQMSLRAAKLRRKKWTYVGGKYREKLDSLGIV